MEGCYSETLSRRYTHKNADFKSNALFMTSEYGSMSRRNAITLFPASSAIVDSNFEKLKIKKSRIINVLGQE